MGKTIRKNDYIIQKVSKRLLQYTFIAVDCGIDDKTDAFTPSENSFIEVYYFLIDKRPNESVISFTALFGTELFDVLKQQIEIIWSEAENKANI
jgi:hypothetical protein